MNDSSQQQGLQGPGKVAIWIVLLLGIIGIVIAMYFMGPWMQDLVNSTPDAEVGSSATETATE